MNGPTPHLFGAPMPDEYLLEHGRRLREEIRERARLRARFGISSLRPRPARRFWRRRQRNR